MNQRGLLVANKVGVATEVSADPTTGQFGDQPAALCDAGRRVQSDRLPNNGTVSR